ncbi:MAG: hypothetical protein IJ416_08680 [Ruminiclostridium sp.]|nr:hypothetical protein [Ruminiclostridium sp.]
MLKDKKFLIPIIIYAVLLILSFLFQLPEMSWADDAELAASYHERDRYGFLIGLSTMISMFFFGTLVVMTSVYMFSAMVGAAKKQDKSVIKRRIVLFFIGAVFCMPPVVTLLFAVLPH